MFAFVSGVSLKTGYSQYCFIYSIFCLPPSRTCNKEKSLLKKTSSVKVRNFSKYLKISSQKFSHGLKYIETNSKLFKFFSFAQSLQKTFHIHIRIEIIQFIKHCHCFNINIKMRSTTTNSRRIKHISFSKTPISYIKI